MDVNLSHGRITSENVTSTFRGSPADQDQFAALSHQKAAKDEREVVPLPVVGQKMVSQDGGVAALSPAFTLDGCPTAAKILAVRHLVGLTKEQVGVYEINEAFASLSEKNLIKFGGPCTAYGPVVLQSFPGLEKSGELKGGRPKRRIKIGVLISLPKSMPL